MNLTSLSDQRICCQKTGSAWNYLQNIKQLACQIKNFDQKRDIHIISSLITSLIWILQIFIFIILLLNMNIEGKQFYSFSVCQLLVIDHLNNGNKLLVVEFKTVLSL